MSTPEQTSDVESWIRITESDAVPSEEHRAYIRECIERGRADVRAGRLQDAEEFFEELEREFE